MEPQIAVEVAKNIVSIPTEIIVSVLAGMGVGKALGGEMGNKLGAGLSVVLLLGSAVAQHSPEIFDLLSKIK